MATLLLKAGGTQLGQLDLQPGANRIGRNPENDFQIDHPSVSGSHCEIIVTDGNIFVRDLGSTNGSFINGQPIREGNLQPGQTLHLGMVELACPALEKAPGGLKVATFVDAAPVASAVPAAATASTGAPVLAKPGLRVAKAEAPPIPPPMATAAPVTAVRVPQYLAKKQRDRRTFFQRLPGAFAYPFKRDGLILLVVGTICYLVLHFVGSYSIYVTVMAFGYLSAYMQKIIVFSGQGEEEMPSWPEFGGWWDGILHPALLLIASFAASFGPAVGFMLFADVEASMKLMVGIPLALFGCFYLPMTLLATAMYGSLMAVNPLLVVPSMIKIPLEYTIVCILLAVLVAVDFVLEWLLTAFIPIPIVPAIITGFLSLYFFTLEMRILGMLYDAKQDDLNWSFS